MRNILCRINVYAVVIIVLLNMVSCRWFSSPEEDLLKAVMENDIAAVRHALEHKADTNTRNQEGKTPLMLTTNLEVAILLLEHGANVNARIPKEKTFTGGWTALNFAEAKNLSEMIELLKKAGAKSLKQLDAEEALWKTLGFSPPQPDLEVVQKALLDGADVNVRNEQGETPLMKMADCGTHWGRIKEEKENEAKYINIFKMLLTHGADVNAKNGKDQTSEYDGYIGYTALMRAARGCNSIEIFQLLFNYGADGNIKTDRTPLIMAAWNGNVDILTLLLQHGANINEQERGGRTALISAAYGSDYPDAIKLLLQHGANINEQDNEGYTPLIAAAELSMVENLKVLLENGADINVKVNAGKHKGWTALKFAKQNQKKGVNNSDECVRLLTQAGAK